jgi:hypothetical protein
MLEQLKAVSPDFRCGIRSAQAPGAERNTVQGGDEEMKIGHADATLPAVSITKMG